MTFIRSNKAFSMIEVVVASVILTGTILVVFASIARNRVPQEASDKKLQAAIYGQKVLAELRGKISVDEWANTTGLLGNGTTHNLSDVVSTVPAGVSGTYTVLDVDGVKKVTANVVY